MDHSRGQLETVAYLRQQYIHTTDRSQFAQVVMATLDVDIYAAELFWELIDIIVDLGVAAEAAGGEG